MQAGISTLNLATTVAFMEESQPEANQALVVQSEGKQPERAEIMPAALLLTPAPIQCLKEELDGMRQMAPHFTALLGEIFVGFQYDTRARDLRETTRKFSVPMSDAEGNIQTAFACASNFFVHDRDELDGNGYDKITKEKVNRLLDADFQEARFCHVRRAREFITIAAWIVRTKAIPSLPLVEQALTQYVSDYLGRVALQEERQKSWVPSALQDVVWGRVDPLPAQPAIVTSLPQHLADGSRILHSLLPFLDRLELYFRRLSEIDNQQIFDLGYTTAEDLTRLYHDRLVCATITRDMASMWSDAREGFLSGEYNP